MGGRIQLRTLQFLVAKNLSRHLGSLGSLRAVALLTSRLSPQVLSSPIGDCRIPNFARKVGIHYTFGRLDLCM